LVVHSAHAARSRVDPANARVVDAFSVESVDGDERRQVRKEAPVYLGSLLVNGRLCPLKPILAGVPEIGQFSWIFLLARSKIELRFQHQPWSWKVKFGIPPRLLDGPEITWSRGVRDERSQGLEKLF